MVDPTGPRLTRTDWLAVAFTAGLLLTLAYTTYVRRPGALPEGGAVYELRPSKQISQKELGTITVWVEGAVAHPRFYTLAEGSTVGDLLRQVELSDQAVTYKLKRREVLEDRQIVTIPHRQRSKRLT